MTLGVEIVYLYPTNNEKKSTMTTQTTETKGSLQGTRNAGILTATYSNKATNETYKLAGVRDIQHAWDLAKHVCLRMDWNFWMFCNDVRISIN